MEEKHTNNELKYTYEMVNLSGLTKYKSSTLQSGKILNDGKYPVYGASGISGYSSSYMFDKEYISIVKDGSGVGTLVKCPSYSSIIGTMGAIIASKNINTTYLYYAMSKINFKNYIVGSTIPHLYYNDFKNVKIKLPKLENQEKVAKLLSSIDDLIEQSLQLENLYNLKKKKYIQLMLNDSNPKFRFSGYTKDWDKYSVSDKYTVIQGLTYKSSDENLNGNVNILRSNSIYNSKLKLENIVKINATNIDNIKFVEQGDVLICLSNGSKNLVGKTAIIDLQLENFAHGAFMGVVRGDNALFFHYLMNSSSGQKAILTSMGSTINNISKSHLEKFEFYFPEKSEMEKISKFLSQIDELVNYQKNITDEYRQLKKYYLNNIFK